MNAGGSCRSQGVLEPRGQSSGICRYGSCKDRDGHRSPTSQGKQGGSGGRRPGWRPMSQGRVSPVICMRASPTDLTALERGLGDGALRREERALGRWRAAHGAMLPHGHLPAPGRQTRKSPGQAVVSQNRPFSRFWWSPHPAHPRFQRPETRAQVVPYRELEAAWRTSDPAFSLESKAPGRVQGCPETQGRCMEGL